MKPRAGSDDAARQKSLIAAMLDPAFYPSRPEEILHKETHISHVFLAGDLVYKIKKPVRFSFLDFSTAAKRRHFLEAELKLNRRLAPAVYLGVVPIFRDHGTWTLQGVAKPAEHALLMRRLPEKRMLVYLLETAQADAGMMEQLAGHVAAFHAASNRVAIASKEHHETTRSDWKQNIAELQTLIGSARDRAELDAIALEGSRFLEKNADLIARRAREGWVRDVHGDLHAEHICFAPEGMQIFDCIEFSDELRCCDLASEIAFLLMDLAVRGGEALEQPFLQRYLEMVHDPDMPGLLPFYKCHRALVRAKVHALRAGRWNQDAARYFDFARRLQWLRFQPFLVLVSGLTGSGKSTLARALNLRLGAKLINSDTARKRIAKSQGKRVEPLHHGIYSPTMTVKTYDAMAREAERALRAGHSVIVDATFTRREQRARFIRLAERAKAPLLVIRCMSSDAVSAERLDSRAAAGVDISDGRWEVYVAQKTAYEPMNEIAAPWRLDLCTEGSIKKLAREAEGFLRKRLSAQARAERSSLRSSG